MRISIITCTYNQKDYLMQMIESVQKSVLLPLENIELEHLIYDDASTDGTHELFENHTWKNVRYFRGTENKGGPSYGRNFLIEKAAGDYIFMIDHDDIILQRTLHNFAALAQKYPAQPWFIGGFLHVDAHLRYIVGDDYYTWNFNDSKEMLTAIFKGEHFIQSSVFIKTDSIREVGGFDLSRPIDQDLDLFVRFLLKGHMPMFCEFNTHLHRMHEKNLSGVIDMKKHLELVTSLKQKYSSELKNIGIE